MKTKLLLVFAVLTTFVQAENVEAKDQIFPSLQVGTNRLKNARLLAITSTNAVIRFENGIVRVRASDLPKEIAEQWFTPEKVQRARDLENQAKSADAKRVEENRQYQKDVLKAKTMRIFDGSEELIESLPQVKGIVLRVDKLGVLVQTRIWVPDEQKRRVNRMQRVGAFSAAPVGGNGRYVPDRKLLLKRYPQQGPLRKRFEIDVKAKRIGQAEIIDDEGKSITVDVFDFGEHWTRRE